MRLRPLLECALVVSACVASGTLECGGVVPTKQVRRGEQLYARMCAVCHGAEGQGYAADQAPALAHPRFIGSVTDGFLTSAIALGRAGTTMSAWSTARGGPPIPQTSARSSPSFATGKTARAPCWTSARPQGRSPWR